MDARTLTTWLTEALREELLPTARIDPQAGFVSMGLSSLGLTRLASRLGEALGRSVSPVDLFEHGSITRLVRHLVGGPVIAAERASEGDVGQDDEPIAIIGMACRFPGAADTDAFWALLHGGVDTITPVPADRWPADWRRLARSEAEAARVQWGGWIEGVDAFDPYAFGLSPREASAMDPQQRLALELCAEALEDAGLPAGALQGSRTAVYAAAIWSDYAMLVDRAGVERVDQYAVTGWHHSIIANRISYLYGLHGPSLTVDAACSSALVALHLASEGLRRGEGSLALVAAVNLNLLAESAVSVARFGALSLTGRCRTFDAGADGYVRGEGGGVVVLKRLSDALRDGDRIHGLLRGSAINNDGPSASLTSPNPDAQAALIRAACAAAGVSGAEVQLVEAHGTGTPLGDPIEARALGAAYGGDRAAPLLVGSAKTNVGHLEGAAGMVGLMKVVLSLHHRSVPPNLHFSSPNPAIDLDGLQLEVPTAARPFPSPERPLLAGVSAFGLGGTNGHVIVEGVARATAAPAGGPRTTGGVALLFPGQGAQWAGMGRALFATEPVFRRVIEACDLHVRRLLSRSVVDELVGGAGRSALGQIAHSLPCIIALDIATAALWQSKGLRPSAVLGHSTGEIAAACVAGALDLADTMQVICAYARAISRTEGQGRMALVEGRFDEIAARVAPLGVHAAIWDSAEATVIGGATPEMEAAVVVLQAEGRVVRQVRIQVCPHTPVVAPLLDGLRADLAGIRPRAATTPFFSELTGGELPGEALDVEHWVRNFVEPARFSGALDAVVARGPAAFLDVGPHPTTLRAAEINLRHAGRAALTLASMTREEPRRETFDRSWRALAAAGLLDAPAEAPTALLLTARSPEALRLRAGALADALGRGGDLDDLAWTLAVRQQHHPERLALTGDRAALVEALEAFAAEAAAPRAAVGRVEGPAPRVVFVFPGQGSQWLGMGRELLDAEPAFRAALEACDAAIGRLGGPSVIEELRAAPEASRMAEIGVVQPVLFAVEVALAALWRSWGVEPDAVVGHSMGEVAAACVAGALTLEDAAAVIVRRSRLLQRVSGQGAMLLTELTQAEAEQALIGLEQLIGLASNNGPRSTVLAGRSEALSELAEALERRGVFCRPIKVDVASHSPQMDPLLPELRAALADLRPQAGAIPLRSTVRGGAVAGGDLDAEYWCANLRQPVRFSEVVRQLVSEGPVAFIEMSPHPILTASVEENLREAGPGASVHASLRRGLPERGALLETLCRLAVRGAPVNWRAALPAGRVVRVPGHPYQRERLWIAAGAPAARAATAAPGAHPFLGAALPLADRPGEVCVSGAIGAEQLALLADHKVHGAVVFPGAAMVDLALAAARGAGLSAFGLRHIELEAGLGLDGAAAVELQLALRPEGGAVGFTISSRRAGDGAWLRHAAGALEGVDPALGAGPERARPLDLEALRAALADARCFDGDEHHRRLRAAGIDHGPAFQGLRALWSGPTSALASARFPAPLHPTEGLSAAALDVCLQLSAAVGGLEGTFIPSRLEALTLLAPPPASGWVHARLLSADGTSRRTALVATDEAGRPWLQIGALTTRRLPEAEAADPLQDCIFTQEVVVLPALGALRTPAEGAVLLYGAEARVEALAARLVGQRVLGVSPGLAFAQHGADRFTVRPASAADLSRALGLALPDGGGLRAALHLASLDGPAASDDPAWISAALDRGAVSAAALCRALLGHGFRNNPATLLVVPAAAEGSMGWIGAAPMVGLARTLVIEHPELPLRVVHLAEDTDPDELLAELDAKDRETELHLVGGRREGLRLRRGALPAPGPRRSPAVGRSVALVGASGRLDGLSLWPLAGVEPGPGEVLIEVERAGLNFLDVLQALGAYPAGDRDAALGAECAGRVLQVGAGVCGLSIGEAVVVLSPGAIASRIVAPAARVVPMPASMSLDEAATTPVAFLTASIALEELARVEPGERVLIHAGTGGVGQAAIQLALAMGAEVFATAGTPEKRALLRTLGASVVADSRSLAFVDAVRAATGGEGVDVVLNSLSGPLADASLDLLRADGRFIEIGKRDAAQDRPLGTRRFLQNLSYTLLDLRGLMLRRPEAVGRRLRALFARFARGELRPTPTETFGISAAEEAFTKMAAGGHTGRIALDLRDPAAVVTEGAEARPWTLGTALITGGLGGLGLAAAARMVERGVRHLLLLGRSAPGEAASATISRLRAAGAQVVVLPVDVSDTTAVQRLFTDWPRGLPPLGGVLHAAAVLDDHMLSDLEPGAFHRVFAAKALGAWNLHVATRDRPLDFFVLYSSVASLLGSPAQANYAAANAFTDALARARRAAGLPATAIQWGAFSEVGLAAAAQNRGARIAARGFESFRPEEGLVALERVLAARPTELGVARFDVRRWIEFHPSLAGSPYLSEIAGPAAPAPTRRFVDGLQGSPAARLAALQDRLRVETAGVLRSDPARLDTSLPFRSLGVDSLLSLELRNRIEALVGRPLSATLLFTHTTLPALAEHLFATLAPAVEAVGSTVPAPVEAPVPAPVSAPVSVPVSASAPVEAPVPAVPAAAAARRRDPIAIVGLACRFPAGGDSPEAFSDALDQGRDGVLPLSPTRWPEGSVSGAGAEVRWAGLIEGVDTFDAAFFGISPREAAQLDPQHRLLLEVTWEALERAGIAPGGLAGSRTGVFIGMCNADYAHLIRRAGCFDDHTATGTMFSTASGRVSFLLGLEGPSLTLDTACSSSLSAIHLAMRSLRDGECDLAIAGGVSLLLDPVGMALAAGTQALSPDGRCKSFDAAANGFVRGEGCGVVVLSRAADAAAGAMPVRALLLGSAMNQDGRSASLSAPNVRAQQAMLRAALADAGVEPRALDYVETHGTGTSLGDPIELEALRAVLGAPTEDGAPCHLGAVKSHIGHLEAAAGVAGLVKVVGSLARERIPGNLHFRTLNPRASLAGTRLQVSAAPQPWVRGLRPRRAGLSSFGISGTNVHLIVEEAPLAAAPPRGRDQPVIVPISGRSPEALSALAAAWADHLEAEAAAGRTPSLRDVAWTAALTRDHHPHRAVVLAADLPSLRRGLRALSRRAAPGGARFGAGTRAHEDAARAWLDGTTVDWRDLCAGGALTRLPTTRWQRRRHWFDAPLPGDLGAGTASGSLSERLRAMVAQVLGLRPGDVGDDTPFAALGLDSLLGISLRNTIEAALGLRVPASALFREGSVRLLQTEVERLLVPDEAGAAPPQAPMAAPSSEGTFLTGATGFLGAHLLVDLLESLPGAVTCLVRAPDPVAGLRRLRSAVRHYAPDRSVDWSRVVAVPGDLASPAFGLGEGPFRALAGSIRRVLHNGATLDFIQPAAALAPANIGGTREAIRLAELAGAELHHVSTVGVLPTDHPTRDGRLLEAPAADGAPEWIPCGYTETKRAAERAVLEAAARGLKVRVYRPAVIAGSSRAGTWNVDDAICRILKGCVQSGVAPLLDWDINAVPVDAVSRGLVRLLAQRPPIGEIVHLASATPLPFRALIDAVRGQGWRVEALPVAAWLARIEAEGPENALQPLVPWIRSARPFVRVAYDTAEVQAALGSELHPALDVDDWQDYLAALVRSGFLPAPEGPPAPVDRRARPGFAVLPCRDLETRCAPT